jgi:hypothetical protein
MHFVRVLQTEYLEYSDNLSGARTVFHLSMNKHVFSRTLRTWICILIYVSILRKKLTYNITDFVLGILFTTKQHVFTIYTTLFISVLISHRNKATCRCQRPLAGWDCGFESHRAMGVCLLWELCVFRYRSLRQAYHTSREAVPTAVRRCVWFRNLVNEAAIAHVGLERQNKNKATYSK